MDMNVTSAQGSDLQALIEKLQAENAKLKANQIKPRAITCKVSEKGALSIYGLGRFPVTLYLSQFEKLDKAWGEVQAFVIDNVDKFSRKD